ncbi:hypothetical protein GGF46_000289 [Coemansia sp. RSA 552]|nr:hypothetical protein GGF46_000289 [Coemansia sp. RSA 552]
MPLSYSSHTLHAAYPRSTIVALDPAASLPTRIRRRDTDSSGATLVPEWPDYRTRPNQSTLDISAFDNTPPEPFRLGISNAVLGLPYAQRYQPPHFASHTAGGQGQNMLEVGSDKPARKSHIARSHLRRPGRVDVDPARRYQLGRPLTRMAGLLRSRSNQPEESRGAIPETDGDRSEHYGLPRLATPQPQRKSPAYGKPAYPHLPARHATAAPSRQAGAAVNPAAGAFADDRARVAQPAPGSDCTAPLDGQPGAEPSSSDDDDGDDDARVVRVTGVAVRWPSRPRLVAVRAAANGAFTVSRITRLQIRAAELSGSRY